MTLSNAVSEEAADHQEGYWVDHWTYNLDLIDAYAAIFPDGMASLLFEDETFTFRDSAHAVRPRVEKYKLRGGIPVQVDAVRHDEDKQRLMDGRERFTAVVQ